MDSLTDLSVLDTVGNSNRGEVVTLTHPSSSETFRNADGSDMTITILGPDSDRWRANRHSIMDRRNALKKSKVSGKELDETLLNSLTAVTIAWNITLNGEKPTCDAKTVREVY